MFPYVENISIVYLVSILNPQMKRLVFSFPSSSGKSQSSGSLRYEKKRNDKFIIFFFNFRTMSLLSNVCNTHIFDRCPRFIVETANISLLEGFAG